MSLSTHGVFAEARAIGERFGLPRATEERLGARRLSEKKITYSIKATGLSGLELRRIEVCLEFRCADDPSV